VDEPARPAATVVEAVHPGSATRRVRDRRAAGGDRGRAVGAPRRAARPGEAGGAGCVSGGSNRDHRDRPTWHWRAARRPSGGLRARIRGACVVPLRRWSRRRVSGGRARGTDRSRRGRERPRTGPRAAPHIPGAAPASPRGAGPSNGRKAGPSFMASRAKVSQRPTGAGPHGRRGRPRDSGEGGVAVVGVHDAVCRSLTVSRAGSGPHPRARGSLRRLRGPKWSSPAPCQRPGSVDPDQAYGSPPHALGPRVGADRDGPGRRSRRRSRSGGREDGRSLADPPARGEGARARRPSWGPPAGRDRGGGRSASPPRRRRDGHRQVDAAREPGPAGRGGGARGGRHRPQGRPSRVDPRTASRGM
jgi:hypothetical protein